MAKGSVGFSANKARNSASKAAVAAAKPEPAKLPVEVPSEIERPTYSPAEYKALEMGTFRARFPDETKPFTDKQLFEAVVMTDDDMSDDDWKEYFLSHKPNNPNEVDGDELAALAKSFGAKASDAMEQTVERLAQAREDWQGGPIYTLLSLRGNYDEAELNSWPVPGSDTGHNPDRFSITTEKGDKKGKRKTTFYAQFTRGTPAGMSILERLEFLDRAADKGAIKDGIPADILEMTPAQRDSHRSFLENRLNTMTTAYKKAMELHIKLREVNAYSETIAADIIWVDGKSPDDVDDPMDAEVVPTNEPIILYVIPAEGKPVDKWEHYSIAAFNKLNPKKAIEEGGGFVKLRDSGATKKAPQQPGAAQTTPDITIKTVDKGVGVLVEFHRWMAEIASAKDGADYGKLIQDLTKKGNDEYTVAAVELKNYLIDLCKNNGLDGKYIKLKQAGSALVAERQAAAQ